MDTPTLPTSQYKPGASTEFENNLILNWYPKRILNRLGGSGKISLLELGIGHGHATPLFNEKAGEHVVVEGSREVIEMFREKHHLENIELVEAYFEEFDTDKRFDVILMGFILEHVQDPLLILSRFREMLAPGGRIFVAVPNAKSLNRRLGLALGKINDIYELNDNDIALGHLRQFCRDTLKDLVARAGFSVTWEEGIYLKPLPLGHMRLMPEFEDNLQAMLEVGVDFPDLCVALMMELRVEP